MLCSLLYAYHFKQGDKVVILSTARKISESEIAPAVRVFESWGLQVVFGANLFHESHQFSGTTEQRTADFQQALDDDAVKAIVCA